MPYTKYNDPWVDADSATGGGDESTPIPAAALDHIEEGIADAHDELANLSADAADIVVTPVGNLAATNAQTALQELQGDIDALDTRVDDLEAASFPWQIVFTALSNEPPASSYATLDTRNSHPVLDFDASSVEYAVFRGVLPTGYGGGGVTVKVIWAASSATSGNCVWYAQWERINAGGQDIDSDSFATTTGVVAAADTVSGETSESSINFADGSEMDSLAAGEMFRLKVSRGAADGSDTMTGDAELLAVVVTEQ